MATANKLMCHVVAGYPTADKCVELMLGMQKLGVGIIEVQIPFSDPIADGETIMRANDEALRAGMNVKKSFEVIKRARAEGLNSPVYIMSYLQKAVHCGFENFCLGAAACGATGLIIPDLPFDTPEYEELSAAAKTKRLQIVPVISPGMPGARLSAMVDKAENLIYLTSMKGITGKSLSVSDPLRKTARKVKDSRPDLGLAVGFGVQNSQDVREILKIADTAVVGSAVIREIQKSGVTGGLKLIKSLAA